MKTGRLRLPTALGWAFNGRVEPQPPPSEALCIYTIRLKNADGTEQLLTKPCPYLSTCKELGRTCADFQERLEK